MVTESKAGTVQEALKKAKEEVKEEKQKKMVNVFKEKLQEVETARVVLRNMERELEELEYELNEL